MIKFTCNSQSKKSCWLLYDFAFLPPEVLNIIFCLDWGGQEFINTLPPLSRPRNIGWLYQVHDSLYIPTCIESRFKQNQVWFDSS